ncbi:hypothetical protein L5515_001846 [Caenorhabditis briggsae]|uniref:VASt domain-containing protein n=1 Tax=Caenorhabditis briggsae TaxID=6238 RepID=A0AAE9E5V0_CAEBR|nr:hypothetical protein L5515_001846 [Caenorhabditis briggsae]
MSSTTTMTMTTRPTSLSDSGVQLSPDAERPSETLTSLATPLSDSNSSMMNDDEKRGDDSQRAKSRMEKYFAEKPDKNIFMKLIHPSYHERNLQFKKIFVDKGLIEDSDQFLASYSCAYQREILAQGRMFISQFNVCFYANIIGWETTLVIPMKEIKLIKKMKAAFIFPNSIQFERDTGEKYFFASFINRDKSFQVLTTAQQKVVGEEGRAMTREEVWDMVYKVKNPQIHTPPEGSSPASTKNASTENMTNLSSPSFNGSISPRTETSAVSTLKNIDKDNTSQSSTSSDFHDDDSAHLSEQFDMDEEEIACPCAEHSGRLLMDKEVKVSVEKFYELVFTENDFMAECNKKTKVDSYVAAMWHRNHQGENTRTCTYTVYVANPLASKDIVVNEKQILTHFPNPKHGFKMQKETQNSGVPYADHFTVNCQYCVSRIGSASCRVKVYGTIVYKKSVWGVVKNFIEKPTYSALEEHYKILNAMFDDYAKKNPEPEKRSLTSVNFPQITESTTTKESEIESKNTPELRHRRSKKSDRLIAGGEHSKLSDEGSLVSSDMHFRSEISRGSQPITVTSSPEYKPFLYMITGLLAAFLILNLFVLRGFQKESTAQVISKNEEDLTQMLSALIEQVKELKEKVDQMNKNN